MSKLTRIKEDNPQATQAELLAQLSELILTLTLVFHNKRCRIINILFMISPEIVLIFSLICYRLTHRSILTCNNIPTILSADVGALFIFLGNIIEPFPKTSS